MWSHEFNDKFYKNVCKIMTSNSCPKIIDSFVSLNKKEKENEIS
jgi:hypothetical protein